MRESEDLVFYIVVAAIEVLRACKDFLEHASLNVERALIHPSDIGVAPVCCAAVHEDGDIALISSRSMSMDPDFDHNLATVRRVLPSVPI